MFDLDKAISPIRHEIKVVTFDVDGTLYDPAPVRWRYFLQNIGRGRALRVILRVREEMRQESFADGAAFFSAQNERIAQRLEISIDEAAKRVEEKMHSNMCSILKKTGPRPDAKDSLKRIHDAGYALVSLSDWRTPDKLDALGLADLPWSAHIAADEVGALKPQPHAFAQAAQRLGVTPAQCLHIGDRLDTDGAGAKAAGCRFVLLGNSHDDAVWHAPALWHIAAALAPRT